MFDILALGESLIDFTPSGTNEMGMLQFARNPGGAPANVLAMAAKLGAKTAFIGKVGKDDFGSFLKSTMENAGIDITGLSVTEEIHTTLAFVQLNENGDRSFTFYRKPGADVYLRPEDVNETLLSDCGIFHFGSVSLTDEPCRSATLYAAKKARSLGALISYDPNYRPLLWSGEKKAKEEMANAIPLADIIKVSEEEMELLTGKSDLLEGARALYSFGPSLVLITLGPKGAFYYNGSYHALVPTYNVNAVDTTGAGDAFLGALLYNIRNLSAEEIKNLKDSDLKTLIQFSNAAGSLTTTKKGAIPAMPDINEIKSCIQKNQI